jgi:hypothetical protein
MSWMKLAALIVMAPAMAMAEHHHHGMVAGGTEEGSSFAAGLSLVAANFDTMEYGGEYQGLVPSVRWSRGRFAASTSMGMYRLEKNGLSLYGAGDAMVHGQANLATRGGATAGVALAVSAPTGDRQEGLGMGHPMVMPAAYGRYATSGGSVDASFGYGRAISGESDHEGHGGPLVDPMNFSELTFTASGELVLARQLRTAARLSGAMPTGEGTTRVIGGVRVLWTEGRVDTAFEIQAGLAGDPFTLRGVLETALRF